MTLLAYSLLLLCVDHAYYRLKATYLFTGFRRSTTNRLLLVNIVFFTQAFTATITSKTGGGNWATGSSWFVNAIP